MEGVLIPDLAAVYIVTPPSLYLATTPTPSLLVLLVGWRPREQQIRLTVWLFPLPDPSRNGVTREGLCTPPPLMPR